MSEDHYKALYAQLKKLDSSFREVESTQRKYGKFSKRMLGERSSSHIDDKSCGALAELYGDFSTKISKSERIIRYTLLQLDVLIESRSGPPGSLLKKRKEDKPLPTPKKQRTIKSPPRTTSGNIIPSGHQVCAKIGEGEWILAGVVKYQSAIGQYHVKDADDEESIIHRLSKDNVFPTQTNKKVAGFEVSYDLPKGSQVLAVFPQTTCFYRATVLSTTKKAKRITEYSLHFEDDEDESGNVPKRRIDSKFVVPYPEKD